jgi:hypothetical protein
MTHEIPWLSADLQDWRETPLPAAFVLDRRPAPCALGFPQLDAY